LPKASTAETTTVYVTPFVRPLIVNVPVPSPDALSPSSLTGTAYFEATCDMPPDTFVPVVTTSPSTPASSKNSVAASCVVPAVRFESLHVPEAGLPAAPLMYA